MNVDRLQGARAIQLLPQMLSQFKPSRTKNSISLLKIQSVYILQTKKMVQSQQG